MIGMLALAIVAFMAWLGYDDHEKTQRVKALTAEVRELTTGRATFDLQQRCAAQAEKQFKTTGDGKEPLAGFENHYNLALGKCFMRASSYTTAGLAARGKNRR